MSPRPETSGEPRTQGGSDSAQDPGSDQDRTPTGRGEPEEVGITEEEATLSRAGAEAVEEDLEAALAASRSERDEYLEMLRRVQADFENYKKRMLRQQTEHLERAAEGLVVRLLPALDAFDLAREHLGESEELSQEGKALVQASALLFDTLAKEGLERVEDTGAPFDPTRHEAVDHEPAVEVTGAGEGEDAAGTEHAAPVVSGVLRAGYRWKGKVIRPAMVRVRG